MPNFKNLKDLEKSLNKYINNALQKEVKENVEETMRDKIQTEVYDAYTPTDYVRSYELLESIEGKLESDGVLSVENTRQEAGKDIVKIIETGKGYTWGYKRNLDEEIGERPFVAETKEELHRTESYKKAFKEGMKRQGVDLE
jgi:hypothetical protein